jgi:hypothetical protein
VIADGITSHGYLRWRCPDCQMMHVTARTGNGGRERCCGRPWHIVTDEELQPRAPMVRERVRGRR